jgi:uncharacterized protein YqiB (DUF1249 family)
MTAVTKLQPKVKNIDPKRVADRVYAQLDKLLTRLETEDEADENAITTPQLINAIKMIAQVMILQANLRAKDVNDPSSPGSAVRKYSQAFKTNAARGGAIVAGPGANDIFDDDD